MSYRSTYNHNRRAVERNALGNVITFCYRKPQLLACLVLVVIIVYAGLAT
jgi:hypothetical protein